MTAVHILDPGHGTECRQSIRGTTARPAIRFGPGAPLRWDQCCEECLCELNRKRAIGGLGRVQDEPPGLTLNEAKTFWLEKKYG